MSIHAKALVQHLGARPQDDDQVKPPLGEKVAGVVVDNHATARNAILHLVEQLVLIENEALVLTVPAIVELLTLWTMQAQAATRSKVSTPSTPARAHRSRRTLSQRAGALGAGHAVRTFTSSPTLRYSIPAAPARAAAVVDLPTPGVPVTRMFVRARL